MNRKTNLLYFDMQVKGASVVAVLECRKGVDRESHMELLAVAVANPGSRLTGQVVEFRGWPSPKDQPATPDEVFTVLEGSCPVHPEVRLGLGADGGGGDAGECAVCSAEIGLRTGYRVRLHSEAVTARWRFGRGRP